MVTGKDAGGDVIIPNEQISRKDALRLYTADNAWYNFEEDRLEPSSRASSRISSCSTGRT
jgi:predicted amidohydrolase YtcJ